jgi:hypothetical protein
MKSEKALVEQIYDAFKTVVLMQPEGLLKWFVENYNARCDQNCEFYAYREGDTRLPLLVAHVDTVFEEPPKPDEILYDRATTKVFGEDRGLGADDRLGVALILVLLEQFPNVGVLLTNYEEKENHCRRGKRGAEVAACELKDEIARYPYLVECDRQGNKHFAHYEHITEEFKGFLDRVVGWCLKKGTSTDIKFICPKVNRCGVNIAIGYYNQHGPSEYAKLSDTVLAYNALCKLLSSPVDKPFVYP